MGNAIGWVICAIYCGVMLMPGFNAAAVYLLMFAALPLITLPMMLLSPIFTMFNTYPPPWLMIVTSVGFIALIGPVRAIVQGWRRQPHSAANVLQPAARWTLMILASWEAMKALQCAMSYSGGAPDYCR